MRFISTICYLTLAAATVFAWAGFALALAHYVINLPH
jgi:hypothetical protein